MLGRREKNVNLRFLQVSRYWILQAKALGPLTELLRGWMPSAGLC